MLNHAASGFNGRRRRWFRGTIAVPEDAPIRRVLKVVSLDAAVPVVNTVDEAVAKLREGV